MEINNCRHNHRYRWTHGFHCEDCDTFFHKNSPTYRSDELLSSIWMVLNNINVDEIRANRKKIPKVEKMKTKIGIGKNHTDYESIISEAEEIMAKYGKNSSSAVVQISF